MKVYSNRIWIYFLLLPFLLASCESNDYLHEELWVQVLSNRYESEGGGHRAGSTGGSTQMFAKQTDNHKIKIKAVTLMGNRLYGYEEWDDSYVLDFDNVFKIEEEDRFGFGGKIEQSDQGTTNIAYNIVWLTKKDGSESLYITFFNDMWHQWDYFEFEDKAKVKEVFKKIVDNMKFE